MINWAAQLQQLFETDAEVILVTVIAVRGSAPREIGAKILFTGNAQAGTIGGGNLEYQARAIAVDMLHSNTASSVHSFALGPSLGQCCGGQVSLLFERVDAGTDWLQGVCDNPPSGSVRWLCRSIADHSDFCFIDEPVKTQIVGFTLTTRKPAAVDDLRVDSNMTLTDAANLWWCELTNPPLPEVWVFGAGHVGLALHRQLQLLPCHAVAIDNREEQLRTLPETVRVIATDAPDAEVAEAPADTWFYVMTHSHALDFDICHAVLKREDFAGLGLIGSDTKRATFEKRLTHRGVDAALVERLTCPIGLTSIQSRQPELIALGVAAELVQRWGS